MTPKEQNKRCTLSSMKVYCPDSELRVYAHDQECFHELMEWRAEVIEYLTVGGMKVQ